MKCRCGWLLPCRTRHSLKQTECIRDERAHKPDRLLRLLLGIIMRGKCPGVRVSEPPLRVRLEQIVLRRDSEYGFRAVEGVRNAELFNEEIVKGEIFDELSETAVPCFASSNSSSRKSVARRDLENTPRDPSHSFGMTSKWRVDPRCVPPPGCHLDRGERSPLSQLKFGGNYLTL